MIATHRNYILRLLAFTAVIAALSALAWLLAPAKYLSPTLPGFPVFFFLVTYFVHRSLTSKMGSGSRFVQQYMIMTIVKLLLFMTILMIYAFVNTPDALPFTISFLFYYLTFSSFEVFQLLRASREAAK